MSKVTHDGNVRGSETYAASKRVDSAANRARCGATRGSMRSSRSESAARTRTLGRVALEAAPDTAARDDGTAAKIAIETTALAMEAPCARRALRRTPLAKRETRSGQRLHSAGGPATNTSRAIEATAATPSVPERRSQSPARFGRGRPPRTNPARRAAGCGPSTTLRAARAGRRRPRATSARSGRAWATPFRPRSRGRGRGRPKAGPSGGAHDDRRPYDGNRHAGDFVAEARVDHEVDGARLPVERVVRVHAAYGRELREEQHVQDAEARRPQKPPPDRPQGSHGASGLAYLRLRDQAGRGPFVRRPLSAPRRAAGAEGRARRPWPKDRAIRLATSRIPARAVWAAPRHGRRRTYGSRADAMRNRAPCVVTEQWATAPLGDDGEPPAGRPPSRPARAHGVEHLRELDRCGIRLPTRDPEVAAGRDLGEGVRGRRGRPRARATRVLDELVGARVERRQLGARRIVPPSHGNLARLA